MTLSFAEAFGATAPEEPAFPWHNPMFTTTERAQSTGPDRELLQLRALSELLEQVWGDRSVG